MATSAINTQQHVYRLLKDTVPEATVTIGMVQTPPRTWIVIGRIEWDNSEWGPFSPRRSRNETYRINVGINLTRGGKSLAECENEVMRIADRIEDALRADPTLDGLVIAAALDPERLTAFPGSQGSEAQFEGAVTCSARI